MGGGVTSIAVFLEGHLVHTDVIRWAANRLPPTWRACWRRLCRLPNGPRHYMAPRSATWRPGADVIPLAQMGEDGDENAMRVPRSMLTRIIQARLEEIFGQVQTRLRASGFDVAAGRRAVLTGGACQLAGVRELAGRVLNKQVRIGRPQSFPGAARSLAGSRLRPAVGRFHRGRVHAARGSQPRSCVGTRAKGGKRMAEPVDRQPVRMI